MSIPVNNREVINDEVVNAVFNIDVESFKNLLANNKFDKQLLNNICTVEEHYCPIQWIVQCWEIILGNPYSWREDLRNIVFKKKNDNQEIKRLLLERFNMDFSPIDITNNELWIYRFDSEDSFDDCFGFSKEEMLSRGHKEIDLELYYAVSRFDFKEVERLLQLGANPNYTIVEEGEWCFSLIEARCADYCLELHNVLFDNVKYNPLSCNYRDLAYLLAWAFNEKMYNLLLKYVEPKHVCGNHIEI